MVAEADVRCYTDMEEISNLLASAANPVEFMCQVKWQNGFCWVGEREKEGEREKCWGTGLSYRAGDWSFFCTVIGVWQEE